MSANTSNRGELKQIPGVHFVIGTKTPTDAEYTEISRFVTFIVQWADYCRDLIKVDDDCWRYQLGPRRYSPLKPLSQLLQDLAELADVGDEWRELIASGG